MCIRDRSARKARVTAAFPAFLLFPFCADFGYTPLKIAKGVSRMQRRGIGFADLLPVRLIGGLAAILAAGQISVAVAQDEKPGPCTDDAMIVFDASGSMSGNQTLGIPNSRARIDEVRSALSQVLPSATRFRRVGLVTYGPGPYNQCNVQVDMKPICLLYTSPSP